MGGKVVTLSDSNGFIYDPEGLDAERLAFVKELKNVKRGRIQEYAKQFKCEYFAGKRPWGVPCQIALPCATQNEISGSEAQTLVGQRLHLRGRRRQHAIHARSCGCFPGQEDPLRPRQGRQRRRRLRQRAGNDARTACACNGPTMRWTSACMTS